MAAVLHTTECIQSATATGTLQDPELACASTQKQQPPPEKRGCLLRKDFCLGKIHKLVSAHGINPNYLILPLLLSHLSYSSSGLSILSEENVEEKMTEITVEKAC